MLILKRIKRWQKTGCKIVMKKGFVLKITFFAMAVVLIFTSWHKSYQPVSAMFFPLELEGEYRQGDGQWQEYDSSMNFSAFDGDLHIRVKLPEYVTEFNGLLLYSNHIEIEAYINDEKVFSTDPGFPVSPETLCIKTWNEWYIDSYNPEDVVEFRLRNPHRAGNGEAFNDFIGSVYGMVPEFVESRIAQATMTSKLIGMVLVVIAASILGTSAAFKIMNIRERGILWYYGLITVAAGGYVWLDTMPNLIILTRQSLQTSLLVVCVMIFCYVLSEIVIASMKKNRGLILLGQALVAFDMALFAAPVLGDVLIYETLPLWMAVQAAVFVVLIACAAKNLIDGEEENRGILYTGIIMMLSVLMDMINSFVLWWPQGLLSKAVFTVLLVFHLILAAKTVPAKYRAAEEAKKLKDELKNSRIVLAMSQIRTHFIFNVLNSISGLCQYDPDEASRAVAHFAKYLRGNINVLQNDELIDFTKELDHLEDYIRLEQMRFGEKVNYEKDIETDAFLIPPLVLQPVVENSIKHGLLRKSDGGTIKLSTRVVDTQVVIEVCDDGVGFETCKEVRTGAVGLENVKFRIQYMIGGSLEIDSQPGNGTKVIIKMPYRKK